MSKAADNNQSPNPFNNPLSILIALAILYFGIQYTEVLNKLEKEQLRNDTQSQTIDKLRNFNR